MTMTPQTITLTFTITHLSGPAIGDADVIREALEGELSGMEFYAQDADEDDESGFQVDDVAVV